MNDVIPVDSGLLGLYASAPQTLPFDTSLDIRAFLLQREQGNLLVYSVSEFNADSPSVRDLGGIKCQYLNHWHEAMFASDHVNAPVQCHEYDRNSAAAKTTVDETFSARHMLDDDFEVIPTPGHTRGATAFLWENAGHRYLFTGDSIYLREGEWVAAMLESSDRSPYIESLELIRELEFDVLVPWAATNGQPFHAVATKSDVRSRIDTILERLRRGEDH